MSQREAVTVRLESFEGPLDLLLYLIQSHELDISTVSVGKITDQYLAYVRLMQELDFDVASEFLVIAATLILWKSKALLPNDDLEAQAGAEVDDILSPADLLRQLLEHQRFLAAGADLGQQPLRGLDTFTRPNQRPPIERIWREMDITSLGLGYQDMLVRARKRTTVLKKETVSVAEKIGYFANRLEVGRQTGLRTLLSESASQPEIVVTFLASLELSRLRKLRLFQEKTYDEIYLELLENIQGMLLGIQTEFDTPKEEQMSLVDATSGPALERPSELPPTHDLTEATL